MTRTFDGLCNVSLLLPHLYQSAAEAIFVERLCRREFCIFWSLIFSYRPIRPRKFGQKVRKLVIVKEKLAKI